MEDHRIEEVARSLRPVSNVAGERFGWTMQDRQQHHLCPGVGVAVYEHGRVVAMHGFGVIEHGHARRIDAQTLFAGASMSKPVTALLALQLVAQGLVDLDTDINRYLKRWQVPRNEFTDAAPVTLRWLLSHKAGTTVHGYGGVAPGEATPSIVDLLEGRAPARPPAVRVDKTPGGRYRYSGGGTTIVELLLEDLTGRRFSALAQERVFGPLGMARATFVHPIPAALSANTASGHAAGATMIPGKHLLSPQLAAGGIYTTPGDYARFMLACREAWLGTPGALLPASLAKEMMTLQAESTFGLGWELVHEGAARRFEHGGSNDGFQCMSIGYLESGCGAVVMTNAESGLLLYWEVLAAVADVYGWPGFLRPERRVVPTTHAERALVVGDYEIVEGPLVVPLTIWEEGDKLMSSIAGLRLSTHEGRFDENGRMFSEYGPWETEIVRDGRGRATELIVLRDGVMEQMRARRAAPRQALAA